jgi:proteasome beta subunit
MTDSNKQAKTGTTTVALVCKDGIVLAADMRVTAGYIAHKNYKKIIQINDRVAITTAGTVSDVQLLSRLMKAEISLKDIQTRRRTSVTESANLLSGMVYNNFRKMSMVTGVTGFLLAGVDETGYQAMEIGIDGSILPIEKYASDGSGSVFALGSLETLYKEGMSVEEGIQVAAKAINTAMQRDTASGNGITVLTVTADGTKFVLEKELNTNLQV